ncbi:MAG: hypothetical protein Q7K44_02280 [Candidatus Liptonbacteria bacterium]|nr:hypothetical protein [Candidatus Liptonbacteria bacterium]
MKNILIVLFAFMLVFPAAAQVTSTPGRNTQEGIRQNVQNIRMQAKQEIQNARQTIQQRIQTEKENFKKTIEAKRVELQSTVQTRRDELKTKLQNIKDARKKAAVERVDKSIADLNSRMTTHYVNVLDQIADVLKRVVSRTDTAQANGKEVTAVRTTITNAENAIAAARVAVSAQVSKTYSINITSDTALRSDVGTTRQALNGDLKKVGDAVRAARDATRQAAVSLAQIQGVDELKTQTSTNQ